MEELTNDAMSPLFLTAVESVEEAILNSLVDRVEAIPIDQLKKILRVKGD
jgi:L-aminopeptidase/D-esterase-like protein